MGAGDGIVPVQSSPAGFSSHLERAQLLYQDSGLPGYFRERSLLWTENLTRRADLLKKLPPVDPVRIADLGRELLLLLNLNPDDPDCLVMAGDYHYFLKQRETALWYYLQARKIAPASARVNLALADYYLNEYQPGPVKKLFKGTEDPRYALRLGAASFQMGEYPVALGYFMAAVPLPTGWDSTRAKDLFKSYLALGELTEAGRVEQTGSERTAVAATLWTELNGWSAWLAGKGQEARGRWGSGLLLNPDYRLWNSNLLWSEPEPDLEKKLPDLHDADLNSTASILQGQLFLKEKKLGSAYNSFLSGVHSDRRSLIGFLGAGAVRLAQGEYLQALDLCNQGLAVNPGFGPLLSTRAAIFRKLGRSAEAAGDQEAYRRSLSVSPESGSLRVALFTVGNGRTCLSVQGKTENLVGFWVSSVGDYWDWYPWWGAPPVLRSRTDKAWVVPTGPGLSGEAYYLQTTKDAQLNQAFKTQILEGSELIWQLPLKVKMVLEPGGKAGKPLILDEFTAKQRIPLDKLPEGEQKFRVRFQTENGFWGVAQVELVAMERPAADYKQPSRFSASVAHPVTNHRLIKLILRSEGNAWETTRISFGEEGHFSEWMPFQTDVDYLLSEGDGPKTVIVRFQSAGDQLQEVQLNLELDTALPQVDSFQKNSIIRDQFLLQWTTSEPVTSYLQIFTDQGVWEESPGTPGINRTFSGLVPVRHSVFCRIVLRDQAGNTGFYYDDDLNTQLQGSGACSFRLNNESNITNSRLVTVKPGGDTIDSWALSNDRQTWSSWTRGESSLKWRLNPGDGLQLVYVKYRIKESPGIKFQVLPVILDTLPPVIGESYFRIDGDLLNLTIRLNEPAQLQARLIGINGAFRDVSGADAQSFQTEHLIGFKLGDLQPDDVAELKITDRAGNTVETIIKLNDGSGGADLKQNQ
ncbi:MAG: tetratricopeptide repeat protein [Bacillota bacterium]